MVGFETVVPIIFTAETPNLQGALPVRVKQVCVRSKNPSPSYLLCLVRRRRFRCRTVVSLISALLAVVVVASVALLGRDYVRQCLLWLDHQEEWLVCAVFLFLYTAVSFPFTWGYIVLNLACGYHFGLIVGLLVTAVAASVGIVFAHLLMKHYFIRLIASKLLKMAYLRATLSALESTHAFKLIAISRLTPIPFGLQNAVFAISPICLWRYVSASALGLFPTQIIGVYLGTTVRSMEEVLVDESNATVGYVVLVFQVVLSVILFVFILRRARREFNKTVGSDGHESESLSNGVPCKSKPWSRKGHNNNYLLYNI